LERDVGAELARPRRAKPAHLWPAFGRRGRASSAPTRGGLIRTLLVAIALCCTLATVALAQETQRIGVRFGSHPEFERMVFDWPQTTRFRVSEEGGRTSIVFERGGDIDQAALARGLARLAQNVTVTRDGERVTVSMTLNEGVHLRTGTSGPKVVVDFTRAPETPPTPA